MKTSTIIVGGTIAAALIIGTGTGAYAAGKITGADIKNGTVTGADIKNGSLHKADLADSAIHALKGKDGKNGKNGKDGDSYLGDAYYSVAFYDVDNTTAGAIASVACKGETDTAISGGVQVLGLDAGANARNTPVSSSFPGRMDWDTNTPKVDRLDGWIVQFGGNAGATSDKAPEKVKVWALCVPGLSVPVEQTYTQSIDD